MEGWLKLHRSIADHWIYSFKEPDKALAWIDLLIMARHTSGTIMLKGRALELKRGQVGLSQLAMQKRWGWSQNKVKRFLKLLKKHSMCDFETNDLTTVITICNFDSFQSDGRTDERPNGRADERTANDQSNDDIRMKERNNEKKGIKTLDQTDVDRLFGFFYESYPKKVDKQKAIQKFGLAFRSMKPAEADSLLDTIINNIEQRVKSGGWDLSNKQYIPSPAKYLLNKLWEDEIIGATNETQQQSLDHNGSGWSAGLTSRTHHESVVPALGGDIPQLEIGVQDYSRD